MGHCFKKNNFCFLVYLQRLTHDFSGQAKSPLTARGSFKMEDYKRTLHTFGTLLLAAPPGGEPVLHATLTKAWGRLRRFGENHTTAHESETEPERLARIEKHEAILHDYASDAVTVRGIWLTPSSTRLHPICTRVYQLLCT